jgi:hypothetical protein
MHNPVSLRLTEKPAAAQSCALRESVGRLAPSKLLGQQPRQLFGGKRAANFIDLPGE